MWNLLGIEVLPVNKSRAIDTIVPTWVTPPFVAPMMRNARVHTNTNTARAATLATNATK